jgi:hypothetical protein
VIFVPLYHLCNGDVRCRYASPDFIEGLGALLEQVQCYRRSIRYLYEVSRRFPVTIDHQRLAILYSGGTPMAM